MRLLAALGPTAADDGRCTPPTSSRLCGAVVRSRASAERRADRGRRRVRAPRLAGRVQRSRRRSRRLAVRAGPRRRTPTAPSRERSTRTRFRCRVAPAIASRRRRRRTRREGSDGGATYAEQAAEARDSKGTEHRTPATAASRSRRQRRARTSSVTMADSEKVQVVDGLVRRCAAGLALGPRASRQARSRGADEACADCRAAAPTRVARSRPYSATVADCLADAWPARAQERADPRAAAGGARRQAPARSGVPARISQAFFEMTFVPQNETRLLRVSRRTGSGRACEHREPLWPLCVVALAHLYIVGARHRRAAATAPLELRRSTRWR